MKAISRILITPGDPAGIGPDIVLKALKRSYAQELVVIADSNLLLNRANELGIAVEMIELFMPEN